MTGSDRIVDHTTFVELHWQRDRLDRNLYTLPPGFQRVSQSFCGEFITILEEIHALQCRRDMNTCWEDPVSLAQTDNHQAWVESRLASLPTSSCLAECCRLAAYISAYMLFSEVWCSMFLPVGAARLSAIHTPSRYTCINT